MKVCNDDLYDFTGDSGLVSECETYAEARPAPPRSHWFSYALVYAVVLLFLTGTLAALWLLGSALWAFVS